MHYERTMSKYMMATDAMHKLGNISSDIPDLCHIYAEDGEDWIGAWVYGIGAFDVKFPKKTTRELTESEINAYNQSYIGIGNQIPIKLKVD